MKRTAKQQDSRDRARTAVSYLIRRGAQAEMPLKEKGGLLIFDPPEGLPKITAHQVKRLVEEW